jgi:periplasmic protein TonB
MDYAERQRNPGKHLVGIGVVVVFHIILIYALVNGLARKVVEVVKGPLETKIIQEIKPPPPEAPPPPPPKLLPPPPAFIPPPEVNITEASPVTNTITTTTKQTAAPPIGVRKEPVVRARSCDEPEYPPASERLGESGRVVVAMLIGLDGRVKDSKIETSSSFPRLDKAAQEALSLCKFEPGTVDGKPIETWGKLAYVFKNPNR